MHRRLSFSTLVRSAGRVFCLVGLALVGYYTLLFFVQRHLLYPAPHGPPAAAGPPDAEPLELRSAPGLMRAWYLPPTSHPGAHSAVIVFLHGNAERGEDWLTSFGEPRAAGVGALVVEYPGYGDTRGAPSQTSLTDAALSGYDWLTARTGIDTSRIVVYGRSLGGGVATRLATRRHAAALILESSFTSLRAFAGRFLAPAFLVRDPYDNLAELQHYHGSLLVLHGERDEVAPLAHGRALAAAVPGAQFVSMPCGHDDCPRPWAQVVAFLRNLGLAPRGPVAAGLKTTPRIRLGGTRRASR